VVSSPARGTRGLAGGAKIEEGTGARKDLRGCLAHGRHHKKSMTACLLCRYVRWGSGERIAMGLRSRWPAGKKKLLLQEEE